MHATFASPSMTVVHPHVIPSSPSMPSTSTWSSAQSEAVERAAHREAVRLRHAEVVDLARLDVRDAHASAASRTSAATSSRFSGVRTLAVVEAGHDRVDGQDDGRGGERAGERSPADLVDAGDDGEPLLVQRRLHLVERRGAACPRRGRGRRRAPGDLDRVGDALALVVAEAADERAAGRAASARENSALTSSMQGRSSIALQRADAARAASRSRTPCRAGCATGCGPK